MAEKIICEKCGRTRAETEFFKQRSGERYPLCKDCLCMYIDNQDPQTFLGILEAFDVPYIEQEGIRIANNEYQKKGKLTGKSVIGLYLRSMLNMKQNKEYRYSDSDRLNFEHQKALQEAEAARLNKQQQSTADLQERFEKGEISQAEFNTLSPITQEEMLQIIPKTDFDIPKPVDNSALLDQLTQEDYQYLSLKWGSVYRPEQGITMETMYNRYANEYDMNIDREEVLKKMCKTSLKMDESLDTGDVGSYKSLAAVFDQLRKSGKFTEAQNKEEKVRYLDTIGELVALAEKAKGPIRNELPDPDEYPQDKIDFTIKDLKAYTYSLVSGEPHMEDLIESFIQKYEKAIEADQDFEEELITSEEEELAQAVTQEEALEFEKFKEEQKELDAEALVAAFGDDLNVT